jgi:hypothetical protein
MNCSLHPAAAGALLDGFLHYGLTENSQMLDHFFQAIKRRFNSASGHFGLARESVLERVAQCGVRR